MITYHKHNTELECFNLSPFMFLKCFTHVYTYISVSAHPIPTSFHKILIFSQALPHHQNNNIHTILAFSLLLKNSSPMITWVSQLLNARSFYVESMKSVFRDWLMKDPFFKLKKITNDINAGQLPKILAITCSQRLEKIRRVTEVSCRIKTRRQIFLPQSLQRPASSRLFNNIIVRGNQTDKEHKNIRI